MAIPPETSDGFNLVLFKGQRRMLSDGIGQFLQLSIDSPLSQGWLEDREIRMLE